jgi:hypothetical protein
MLNLPAAYDAAAKIANFHHMSHLYERIILLKEASEGDEQVCWMTYTVVGSLGKTSEAV